jgi:hypothetical protein
MEEAHATVIDVEDTGWLRGDGQAMKVRLSLRVESEPVYETAGTRWIEHARIPRPGDRITIRHDPANPDDWTIERRRDSDPLMTILHHAVNADNALTETPEILYDVATLHPAERPDDRIEKLRELRESGVISLAEYTFQRDQVEDEL